MNYYIHPLKTYNQKHLLSTTQYLYFGKPPQKILWTSCCRPYNRCNSHHGDEEWRVKVSYNLIMIPCIGQMFTANV